MTLERIEHESERYISPSHRLERIFARLNGGILQNNLQRIQRVCMQLGESFHLRQRKTHTAICVSWNRNAKNSSHIDFEIAHVAVGSLRVNPKHVVVCMPKQF